MHMLHLIRDAEQQNNVVWLNYGGPCTYGCIGGGGPPVKYDLI